MNIPKSQKLRTEESKHGSNLPSIAIPKEDEMQLDGPIKIRAIPCCNEIVAVLRFKYETGITLPDQVMQRNEGIVVGNGPGVPASDGTRCPSQVALGDVVMFRDKDVVTKIEAATGVYKNQQVVLIGERSLLCKLPAVPFEIVE